MESWDLLLGQVAQIIWQKSLHNCNHYTQHFYFFFQNHGPISFRWQHTDPYANTCLTNLTGIHTSKGLTYWVLGAPWAGDGIWQQDTVLQDVAVSPRQKWACFLSKLGHAGGFLASTILDLPWRRWGSKPWADLQLLSPRQRGALAVLFSLQLAASMKLCPTRGEFTPSVFRYLTWHALNCFQTKCWRCSNRDVVHSEGKFVKKKTVSL